MSDANLARVALDVAPRAKKSVYPPEFAKRVEGREKRQLGDAFGLTSFGVNLTILRPGAQSALMHRHEVQDEFIYVLEGTPDLMTDQGTVRLSPGMCAGFPAKGVAHHLVNNTSTPVTYLEIGDRQKGDSASYPNDDLVAVANPNGGWVFAHKDGTPYPS
ncbi:MAG: cupin domain-containing protein [Hyphomicrobiaceae bacterium]|nr:cupin domain-containing protein [Hyphomicrobiaceae bacterium]